MMATSQVDAGRGFKRRIKSKIRNYVPPWIEAGLGKK